MPLQPSSQGLITPTGEVVHILRQLQALPKASSNSSTLTWSPVSSTGVHRKRSAPEPKNCLPSNDEEGGGHQIGPNLYSWAWTLASSWMTTASGVKAGGILGEVSLGLLGGWLVVRGLFRARAARGADPCLGFVVATQGEHRVGIGQWSCFVKPPSHPLCFSFQLPNNLPTWPLLGRQVGLQHGVPQSGCG